MCLLFLIISRCIVACFIYIGDDHESNVSSFLKALKDVLEDNSFKTASPVVAEVRKVAVGLLEWSAADVNQP